MLIFIKILLVSVVCVSGQDDYSDHLNYMESYDFSLRPVPKKPSGDLTYKFTGRKGKILRCYDIDRDGTFGLLYERIKSMENK